MRKRFVIKKYDGDDQYSYAVFKREDVKGIISPIMYGQAEPIVSGCSKYQAIHYRNKLEEEATKNAK